MIKKNFPENSIVDSCQAYSFGRFGHQAVIARYLHLSKII
jgi:hypothetical protein